MDSFWRSSWDCADLTEFEESTFQLRPSRISNITNTKRASTQNESFEFFSLQLYVFPHSINHVCGSLPNWLYSVWNCIQFTRNDIWCHFHKQIYHRSLLTDPNTSSITFRRSWCLFFIHFFPTNKRREKWIHVKDHTMKEVDIRLSGQTNTHQPIFLLSNIEH